MESHHVLLFYVIPDAYNMGVTAIHQKVKPKQCSILAPAGRSEAGNFTVGSTT